MKPQTLPSRVAGSAAPLAILMLLSRGVTAGYAELRSPFPTGTATLNLPLGDAITFSKGGVTSSEPPFQPILGLGSAAFRPQGETDPLVIYTASDRGPNLDCQNSSESPIGIADFCLGQDGNPDEEGKVFPVLTFAPSIYKLQLQVQGDRWVPLLLETLPLKDSQGQPITGLPNDLPPRPEDITKLSSSDAVVANTENAYDARGMLLSFDQNGLDVEGLAQAPDGSFWLADEYAPSLIHAAADGRILERIVPDDSGLVNPITGRPMSVCDALKEGTETNPAARYPITCALPAILNLRSLNRGFENLAISNDGKTLYFAAQSPLANPSKAAYKNSRNVRIFTASLQADGSFDKVTGEYVYLLDLPETFLKDESSKQNDVKLSEMSISPQGQLIQLERISKTTKLYQVDLNQATNILGTDWDSTQKQPSLEEQTDLAAVGIVPVDKKLIFNSDTDLPNPIAKIEGVAFLDDQQVLLVNDNDFGISGNPTALSVVRLQP
ncbi:MAG: esterase-like activity of phytase family protein [Cyanobacteriota bacterium]